MGYNYKNHEKHSYMFTAITMHDSIAANKEIFFITSAFIACVCALCFMVCFIIPFWFVFV